jgi:hypothetical protein
VRAETLAERRRFYAVATWVVPGFALVIPAVPLLLAYGHMRGVAGTLALVVVIGGVLVARHGRSAVAALFVGAVLGGFAAFAGLLGLFLIDRLGAP